MLYMIIKAALSGILVMLISEISRRSPSVGGLIASLPLISVLGMIWLWKDSADIERVAQHAESTFWFVLPTLPMFLLLPYLLRHGFTFWFSLTGCCVLTSALYAGTIWLLNKWHIAA